MLDQKQPSQLLHSLSGEVLVNISIVEHEKR